MHIDCRRLNFVVVNMMFDFVDNQIQIFRLIMIHTKSLIQSPI
jgi:hypothetical protein